MDPKLKLTESERETLDRVREPLREQGLRMSDEKIVLAILKAASQLAPEDLARQMREGLESGSVNRDST